MSSLYTSTTSLSSTNTGLLGGLENQITSGAKSFEKATTFDTIVSIVVGGTITAVVWFFVNRYLSEKFPPKENERRGD